jgi:hypothetical protein
MKKSLYIVVTLLVIFVCQSSFAEQFIGIEEDDELAEDYEEVNPQKSPPRPLPEDDPILKRYSPQKDEEPSSLPGRFGFSAALGAGSGSFYTTLVLHYFYNEYLGIDTRGFYSKYVSEKNSEEVFGPEVDGVVRLPNPTMVTPFAGAGPGYEKWLRKYDGKTFDDSGSFTLNLFYGLHIKLAGNFGMQVTNRQKTYIDDPPRVFSNRRSREDRSSSYWDIGFIVMF